MSEKVKITQEQAEKLEEARERYKDDDIIVIRHAEKYYECKFDELFELTTAELARALYIGYEVEPEINDGDFLLHIPMNVIGKVINGIVYWSDNIENDVEYINRLMVSGEIRHATPEEIAKEKERRWWKKHSREVWQLKRHDVLKSSAGNSFEVSGFYGSGERQKVIFGPGHFDHMSIVKESYKVVCFAEDRKDV